MLKTMNLYLVILQTQVEVLNNIVGCPSFTEDLQLLFNEVTQFMTVNI